MSAIGSNLGTSSTDTAGIGDKYNSMSSGDFLKVMFTELTRQDPLQPSESKDLLEQIATIRSIESNLSLSDNLKTIVRQNEVSGAGTFVGQTITGTTDQGLPVEGVVRSVSVTRDGAALNLVSGERVQMKNVKEILGFMLEEPVEATP